MAITIDGADNKLEIGANATGPSSLRLYEDTDNGTNYVSIIAPSAVTSNRTITLPDASGTLNTSGAVNEVPAGSASAPSIYPTGDTNTGIFFPAADTIAFAEGGAEAMRIDSDGDVGIGTTSPSRRLTTQFDSATTYSSSEFSSTSNSLYLRNANTTTNAFTGIEFLVGTNGEAAISSIRTGDGEAALVFGTRGGGVRAERARITSGGQFFVAKTVSDFGTAGFRVDTDGTVHITAESYQPLGLNRLTNDGTLVLFAQAGTTEGTISVSGSTVSYNGGHLSRWAQMLTKPDLLKGTVMSNLDEMNVYIAPTTYWTEEDELPEGVNVGDVRVETHEVENEQLNKVKVSDVEGDVNVAGVFVNWDYDEAHQVDEINMAMTGDMIIRIAQGVVVQKGDLLMSAGDGTAKPQGDDIVRSKTVAKVTSNHVTCTYTDGSYCVPCVLMAC